LQVSDLTYTPTSYICTVDVLYNHKNWKMAATTKPFPPGIHVPSLTFFRDDARQEIDWEVQEKHVEFLISSGLHGSEYEVLILLTH